MEEFLKGAFLVALGFLIFVVTPWFLVWTRRKMREAVREAAKTLRLAAADPEDGEWNVDECFRGPVEGMTVTLARGTRVVPAGGTAAMVSGVLVEARAPAAPTFPYHLARGSSGLLPDPDFSGRVAVDCVEAEKMKALLEDAGLRRRIADFLKDGKGSAWVDEERAFFIVFDAHYGGPPRVLERARQALGVVKGLHERAVRLGFVAGPA